MNTATLTREQLRQRIDTLEALGDVMAAIDDVSGVEFEPGEPRYMDMQISTRSDELPVAFANGLPQEVVLAGLQAMREKLEALQ